MNENIDLTKILKNCPKGTVFYSPIFGNVSFERLVENGTEIMVITERGTEELIHSDATASFWGTTSVEPMLFPDRDQRDWSKWKCPKPKFDPKTFKAFDKVLSYSYNNEGYKWVCKYFSHLDNNRCYFTCGAYNEYCIPYNEETKYLVGLTEAAPKYYRYWED